LRRRVTEKQIKDSSEQLPVSQRDSIRLIRHKKKDEEKNMTKILQELATNPKTPDENDLKIREIVVAVDLSSHSEETASYAAELAKSLGASITLVHVFAPEVIPEFSTEAVHASYEEQRRSAELELTGLAEKVRETCFDCDTQFRVGDPADEIRLVALSLNADLVITASHHPSFLARLFGVDQAPHILHSAPCPVLVYHEGRNAADATG
jgi:nucleotide-binding universal stress UspA family protein